MKVAIVHDWLTGMRGGEKVLEAICELYPDATLHTLVRDPRIRCIRRVGRHLRAHRHSEALRVAHGLVERLEQ